MGNHWTRAAALTWLTTAILAGCKGEIASLPGFAGSESAGGSPSGPGAGGASASGPGAGGSPGFPAGGGAGASASGSAGSAGSAGSGPTSQVQTLPLRRLTPFELDNALRDLTGDTSGAALELRPGNTNALIETNTADNRLNATTTQSLELITDAAARTAAKDLDALLGCTPSGPGDACVQGFVQAFGRRAFRRSLSPQEAARYVQLEAQLEGKYGRGEAVARTVQAFLMSPNFLYLTSFGLDGGAFADTGPDAPLEDHELAARLSFFLWGSLPDEPLLAAADAGQLRTPAQVQAQVDRLLGPGFNARSSNAAARFVAGWLDILDLPKQTKNDPAWNPSLVRSMLGETDALVKDWFTQGERGIAGLVDADYSFVDENLATLYGLGGVSGGEPVRVQIAEQARRRGVLAHASVLAAHATSSSSSPVHRGQWLLERVLCAPSAPAPVNANTLAPPRTPDMTTRDWNEAIMQQCGGGCHTRLAPPGFLFEDFDPIGRRRDTDSGQPVVTETELETGTAEIDGPAVDHQSLATKLAASEILPACMAEQWLGYALSSSQNLDPATRAAVSSALKVSARDAMRTIATSDSFRLARRNLTQP